MVVGKCSCCHTGLAVGPAYLFFGCRTRQQDFIYEAELKEFLKSGALTELHVAFSREGKSKDYVQHQLQRQAQTVAYMLSDTKDAHGVVYVCGDAKHMATVSLMTTQQTIFPRICAPTLIS